MIVELSAITEGGAPRRVDVFFPEDGLQLDPGETSLHLKEPITGSCELTRLAGDRVRVQGEVKTRLSATCSRCLNRFSSTVEQSFDLIYAPDPTLEGGDEINLKYDDLEVGFYRGDKIDLSTVVAEPIFIDLPMKLTCSPDCKGLCDQCGTNLNESECDCQPPPDMRWQALAEFSKKLT